MQDYSALHSPHLINSRGLTSSAPDQSQIHDDSLYAYPSYDRKLKSSNLNQNLVARTPESNWVTTEAVSTEAYVMADRPNR